MGDAESGAKCKYGAEEEDKGWWINVEQRVEICWLAAVRGAENGVPRRLVIRFERQAGAAGVRLKNSWLDSAFLTTLHSENVSVGRTPREWFG